MVKREGALNYSFLIGEEGGRGRELRNNTNPEALLCVLLKSSKTGSQAGVTPSGTMKHSISNRPNPQLWITGARDGGYILMGANSY